MMTISNEVISQYRVGDVLEVDGHIYILTKKTTTACALTPYHWWDRIVRWYKLHVRGTGGSSTGNDLTVNRLAT